DRPEMAGRRGARRADLGDAGRHAAERLAIPVEGDGVAKQRRGRILNLHLPEPCQGRPEGLHSSFGFLPPVALPVPGRERIETNLRWQTPANLWAARSSAAA